MLKLLLTLILTLTIFAQSEQTLKIVYNSGIPPIKFTDKNNQANGILIDIWKLWAKKTNQKIEFIEAPWKDTLLMIKDGRADIHGGLYFTKSRDEYLDYTSKPLYENKNYFFYHKDIKNINSNQDILPFVVGIGNGFPRKFMKKNYPNVITKEYDKNMHTIHAIQRGELKVVLNPLAGFTYLLKNHNINIDTFKYVENNPAFIKKYFGAVKNGNIKLLKFINDGFKNISSKELKTIENRWTKDLDMSQFLHESMMYKKEYYKQTVEIKKQLEELLISKQESLIGITLGLSRNHDIVKVLENKKFSNINFNSISLDLKNNTKFKNIQFMLVNKKGIVLKRSWTDKKQDNLSKNKIISKILKKQKMIKSIEKDNFGVSFKTSVPIFNNKKEFIGIFISIAHFNSVIKKLNKENINIVLFVDKKYKKQITSPFKKIFIQDYYLANKNIDKNLLNKLNKTDIPKLIKKITKDDFFVDNNHIIVYHPLKNINGETIGHFLIYYPVSKIKLSKKKKIKQIILTKKERQFIIDNPTIKIVANQSWPPFDFINKDTNKPDGIAADYIRLLAQKTNLKFKYVKATSWDESIKRIKNRELDIFGVIKQTPKREEYLKFTNTYVTFPMVAITKNEIAFVNSIEDIKDKKFAMIKNFASTEYLKTNYPNVNIILFKNAKQCMDTVSKGKADVFIGSLGTVSFLLKEQGYVNLKIAGKIGMKSSWGIGVRADMKPELISIFNKALKSINQKQKDEILNKWISIKFEKHVDYTIIYQILGIFGFFVLGTIYWNRKLSHAKKAVDASEIKIRSIVENSHNALIVIDTKSTITTWNNAATQIFGFSKDEMFGNSIEKIIPHKYKKAHFDGIERVSGGGINNLIGKGSIEIEGLRKDGTIIPIDLTLSQFKIENELFFSASIHDISERKTLRTALEDEKQFVDSIINSQENFVLTTDGLSLKTANSSFLNFFNVKSVKEFVERIGNCICDTFDTNAPKEYIQKQMGDERWLDYVYNRPDKIHKAMIQRDDKTYIFTITSDRLNFKGEVLKTAVLTDVTVMEQITQEISQIHKHTKDSIEYASLIQGALIPDKNIFDNYFKDSFVIWDPKDTIGGDIYLFEELRDNNECLLMFIDCTGHGVPGAFVTMLVKAIERQIIAKIEHDKYQDIDISPAWILSYFNRKMKQLLKQDNPDSLSNVGFDGGIIYYNKKEQILKFSGAETPLFYFNENNEFITIKGSRYSVGYKKCNIDYEYKEHSIKVKEGMKFYCTTDGYIDQNGGLKGFPFGKKRFSNIIQNHHTKSFRTQKQILLAELSEYQADEDRNDDITVVGLEIKDEYIDTILEYNGELTQSIITHYIQILENKISDLNIISKVSTVTIELTQNMMNYSKSHYENCEEIIPAGYIEVVKSKDNNYCIKSRNIISEEDKEKIEPKLLEIQSLDIDGIKKTYKELRKSGVNTHLKGGGIGFYEIAKFSRDIKFKFNRLNKEKFSFELQVYVERRSRNREEKIKGL